MRGLGAAARRGAHLPFSYAAAFSSFSGVGGGGGGAGRGRGSGPSPFGQPRAPGRPITDDDDDADSFAPPDSVGRGRGEPVVPSSPSIPPYSAFSGAGRGRGRGEPVVPSSPTIPPLSTFPGSGRGRGEPMVPSSPTIPPYSAFSGADRGRGSTPPAAEDDGKQHFSKHPEDASPISHPERPSPGASFSALPRSIPSTGAGRGVPRFQQPPADKAPEENRFTRRREAAQAAKSSSAPSTQTKLSAEDAVKRAMELLGGGEGAGGPGDGGCGGRGRGGRGARGGRGGRGRGRGDRSGLEEVDDQHMIYLGEDADDEKLENRLGADKMKILDQAFEEAADNALPDPMEDAYMDACHTNNMIEFEPEYHVNFDNPDIDDKPPMSLEEMLQNVKSFIVAYEGIQNQEEWEVTSFQPTQYCFSEHIKQSAGTDSYLLGGQIGSRWTAFTISSDQTSSFIRIQNWSNYSHWWGSTRTLKARKRVEVLKEI